MRNPYQYTRKNKQSDNRFTCIKLLENRLDENKKIDSVSYSF